MILRTRSWQATIDIPTSASDLFDERVVDDHPGQSGASIGRARLRDGTPVVVKRSGSSQDRFQRLLGHEISLEHRLWQDGTLARLPRGVATAILGSWIEGDVAVIVMSDLGDEILDSSHAFSRDELLALLERVERLHRARLSTPHVTDLSRLVSLFSSLQLRTTGEGALADEVDRGWEVFAGLAPAIAAPVLALVADPRPVVAALVAQRPAFCHGDLAAVNLAWHGGDLVLLDWGQAFRGPPALEVARFLPSGLVGSEVHPDTFLDDYRTEAGSRFDAEALELSVLATLVWYGWKKSLDVVETNDPQRRARELDNLLWWCDRVRPALRILDSSARRPEPGIV